MQVRAKQASRQEYARQRWLRGCGAVCSGRGRERAEGGKGPVLRVRRCAAAVSGMGFVGLGKCGVGGVWLDKVLRPRLGNEGLEQGMMMGWNAVLGGSDEGACLWEKHGCLVTKLGGLGMQ